MNQASGVTVRELALLIPESDTTGGALWLSGRMNRFQTLCGVVREECCRFFFGLGFFELVERSVSN